MTTEESVTVTGDARVALRGLLSDAPVVRVLPESGAEPLLHAACRVAYGVFGIVHEQVVAFVVDDTESLERLRESLSKDLRGFRPTMRVVTGHAASRAKSTIRLYGPNEMGIDEIIGVDVLIVHPDYCRNLEMIRNVSIARQVVLVGESAQLPEGWAEKRGGQNGTFWAKRPGGRPVIPADDNLVCRTFSETGLTVCDQPAEFVVWGHLYEKGDKGPKCRYHLPPGTNGYPVFGTPAIFPIPKPSTRPMLTREELARAIYVVDESEADLGMDPVEWALVDKIIAMCWTAPSVEEVQRSIEAFSVSGAFRGHLSAPNGTLPGDAQRMAEWIVASFREA